MLFNRLILLHVLDRGHLIRSLFFFVSQLVHPCFNDTLVCSRFHIPSSELAGEDPVESFQQNVMNKASVINVSGDALAIFREIHCLNPRGRYDIKVYSSFFQLHGKYKIETTA